MAVSLPFLQILNGSVSSCNCKGSGQLPFFIIAGAIGKVQEISTDPKDPEKDC